MQRDGRMRLINLCSSSSTKWLCTHHEMTEINSTSVQWIFPARNCEYRRFFNYCVVNGSGAAGDDVRTGTEGQRDRGTGGQGTGGREGHGGRGSCNSVVLYPYLNLVEIIVFQWNRKDRLPDCFLLSMLIFFLGQPTWPHIGAGRHSRWEFEKHPCTLFIFFSFFQEVILIRMRMTNREKKNKQE